MTREHILITNAAPDRVLAVIDAALSEPHETLADRIVVGDNETLVEVYEHDYETDEAVPFEQFPTAVDAFSPRRDRDDDGRARANALLGRLARALQAADIEVRVVDDLERLVP